MVNSCVMFEQIFCIVWATFVYLWFVAAWCDLLRLCCNLFVTFVTCLWLCYGCCNLFETFWKLFETVLKLFETVCDWLWCFVTVRYGSRLVVFRWISFSWPHLSSHSLYVFLCIHSLKFYENGWSRTTVSFRTTLSIPENEVRPKRKFGPPIDILSFIQPISISLKWHILIYSPLFEKQHLSPWFELKIANNEIATFKIQTFNISTNVSS